MVKITQTLGVKCLLGRLRKNRTGSTQRHKDEKLRACFLALLCQINLLPQAFSHPEISHTEFVRGHQSFAWWFLCSLQRRGSQFSQIQKQINENKELCDWGPLFFVETSAAGDLPLSNLFIPAGQVVFHSCRSSSSYL